jgi:hypothetical protein
VTPDSIDIQAPVVSRQSVVIAAPLGVLWQLQTGVNNWPTWQHDIDEAHLDGAFGAGATFSWRTHVLSIDSTVYRVEPERHTLWGGPAEGTTSPTTSPPGSARP